MCRLLVLGHYVRNTSCCISLSKKYAMRFASSKHFWAGSQAFMDIEGISHFDNENEVDRLARSFLNDDAVLDENTNRCYELNSIRHLKELNELNQDLSKRDGKFQMSNSDKTDIHEVKVVTNTETSKLNNSTNNSFADFAKLEHFVKCSKAVVVENSHHDAIKGFNNSGITLKNLNITLRGVHKNSTLGAIELNPEMGSTEFQNVAADNRKGGDPCFTPQSNTELRQKTPSKSSECSDKTTYKPFQTIEVPIETAEKQELVDGAISDYNPASMPEENNLEEGQTVLNDTKSRILIRYALLKALYILESGGSRCKTKIVFRTPDKAKVSQK